MKAAVKTGKQYPKGNWIHVFDGFDDIVATLRQAIGAMGNLRRRSLVANLKHEILGNLRRFLEKNESTGQLEAQSWHHIKTSMTRQIGSDFLGVSEIDVPTMNSFCMLSIMRRTEDLETTFLEEALRSGEFLDYDRSKDVFCVGPMQTMLIELRDAIQAAVAASQTVSKGKNLFAEYGSRDASAKVRVNNVDLISPISMLEARERVVPRLVAAYKALHADVIPAPMINESEPLILKIFDFPTSALPSFAEIERWLDAAMK